ncbi:MAG: RDD family protein [Bacteroidetes bacterium]|nr:RDD family protein [Bacteroidota bacterium]
MEEINSPESKISNQASIGDRLLGGLIDWIVVLVIYYLLKGLVGWSLSYLVAAAYILVRDALPFLEGQSIGKKVMKTRGVHEDSGAPITNDYRTSFLRNIFLFIPIVSLIDALFIFSGDRKRLGDRIAKTIVVYHK